MLFSCLQRLLRGVLHWYAFCSTAIYYEVLLKRNTYCSEGGQRGNLVHCTCCLFTERETHKDGRQVLVVGSQFKLILYERSHNHRTTITLLTLWKVNILKLKWKLRKSLASLSTTQTFIPLILWKGNVSCKLASTHRTKNKVNVDTNSKSIVYHNWIYYRQPLLNFLQTNASTFKLRHVYRCICPSNFHW